MVMSMAVTLTPLRGPRFSIPYRVGRMASCLVRQVIGSREENQHHYPGKRAAGRAGYSVAEAWGVGLVASDHGLRFALDEDAVGVIEGLDEPLYVPSILLRT